MTDRTRNRRAMLAKVHIAKKALGLDEDSYRAVIERVSGGRATSSGALSLSQLDALLARFKDLGWKPAAPTARGRTRDRQSAKVRALWLALAEAGVVRDRSEAALRAYCRRQVGVEDLRFADSEQKSALIEALKGWSARAGLSGEGDHGA